jgi:hypothetical protein
MSFQRISDPKPPLGGRPVRMARRLTLKPGGWYLSLRDAEEVGPFATANAAMTASRDLDVRLHGVDALQAETVIESFAAEWKITTPNGHSSVHG